MKQSIRKMILQIEDLQTSIAELFVKLSGGGKEELLGIGSVEADAGGTVVVRPGGGGRVTLSLSPSSPWG